MSTPPPDPSQGGAEWQPPPTTGWETSSGGNAPYGLPYGQPYAAGGQGRWGPPGSFGGPPAGPPPSYLAWAIITTLLCCLPAGIVSIVYAAQVNSKYVAGNYQGALESSRKARFWAILSAVSGVAIVAVFVVGAVLTSSSFDYST